VAIFGDSRERNGHEIEGLKQFRDPAVIDGEENG
jgi:hypothetical protein